MGVSCIQLFTSICYKWNNGKFRWILLQQNFSFFSEQFFTQMSDTKDKPAKRSLYGTRDSWKVKTNVYLKKKNMEKN